MTSTQRPVHLLDHGTGTGQVARLLHERIPGCTVHCLDPSADLLRSAPQAPWEPWGSAQLGTAADLHDHDRFDGCVSNLVLPFTANTIEDLRRIRATLAAGAPLVAVTLGTAPEVEPFHQFWDAYHSLGDSLGHSFWPPERYVHFRFGRPPMLHAVFHAAGFENVQLSTVEATRILSPEAVWDWLSSALPVGTEDGYVTPEPALSDAARHCFLKCSEGRTSWATRCLIACATA